MGSVVMKKTEAISRKEKSRIRSKGDRLGWKSLCEEKRTPLIELVGQGEIVKEERNLQPKVAKMVL